MCASRSQSPDTAYQASAPWAANAFAASSTGTRSTPARSPSLASQPARTPSQQRQQPPHVPTLPSHACAHAPSRQRSRSHGTQKEQSTSSSPTARHEVLGVPSSTSPQAHTEGVHDANLVGGQSAATHTGSAPQVRGDDGVDEGALPHSQSEVTLIQASTTSRQSEDDEEKQAEVRLDATKAELSHASQQNTSVQLSAAAATRAAAALIQQLVENWVPCENADLPPRYRNVAGYYCDYCTYSVCQECLAGVPGALLEPVPGAHSQSRRHPGAEQRPPACELSDEAASLPLSDAIAAMTRDLLTGHEHFHRPAPSTAATSLAPSLSSSRGACLRCHLCKRGVLVHEVALLHEWSCEGPMPEARVRRRHSVVYDTDVLQRYHFMKEQRQARQQTQQRLAAHFHGYYRVSAHGGGVTTAMTGAPRLQRLPGRPARCEEGCAFVVSVDNPRLAEGCVWCTVNYAARNAAPGVKGTMTVTPVLPWVCPPSLPGVPPRRYAVHVPDGAYTFDNAHALALFLRSDIFRKASTQLTMVAASPSSSGHIRGGGIDSPPPSQSPSKKRGRHHRRHGGGQRRSGSHIDTIHAGDGVNRVLGTTLVIPAGAIESLLTVSIIHRLETDRVPPPSVRSIWGAESVPDGVAQPGAWRMEPFVDAEEKEDGARIAVSPRKRMRAASPPVSQSSPLLEGRGGVREKSTTPANKKPRLDKSESDTDLAWPTGLASDELRLVVDHLTQGRSLAVYGLGSKRFFLRHAAQSASLKDYLIVPVDGALSARPHTLAELGGLAEGHIGAEGSASTVPKGGTRRQAGGSSSVAARRLRDVTRYLTSRLQTVASSFSADLVTSLSLAEAEMMAAEREAERDGLLERRLPETRSRSLPRDTTAGTLAAAASAPAGASAAKMSLGETRGAAAVADIVDVDEVEADGVTDAHPPTPSDHTHVQREVSDAECGTRGTRPVGAVEGLRTPPRPSVSAGHLAGQELPPPTQLRPRMSPSHSQSRTVSQPDEDEGDEDGVGHMVMALAKALSSPIPSVRCGAASQRPLPSPSPRRGPTHHTNSVRRDSQVASQSTAPRVEIGLVPAATASHAGRTAPAAKAGATAERRVGETLQAACQKLAMIAQPAHTLSSPLAETVRAASSSFTLDIPYVDRGEDGENAGGSAHSCEKSATTSTSAVVVGVRSGGSPHVRFAHASDYVRALEKVRRLVGGHCTRWHRLPSVTARALVGDAAKDTSGADGDGRPRAAGFTLAQMRLEHRSRAQQPPVLLVVHHVDMLDAEAEMWLLQLCRRFAFPQPHVQLLVSFDRPDWPLSSLAVALAPISLVLLQLRSLLLPRVKELREVHTLDLLTSFESAAAGAGASALSASGAHSGGGHGQHALPLQDTMRRVLFSLPATFAELLHILLTAQEEHGENHYISLFTLNTYFEKNGLLVSHGRMKALQRELTSNRLAVYDAAEHAVYIPQHRKLAKVLEEVTALRRGGGDARGFADTTG